MKLAHTNEGCKNFYLHLKFLGFCFFPDQPPSYESIFGQVRRAKRESSGVVTFFKQFFIIILGTSTYVTVSCDATLGRYCRPQRPGCPRRFHAKRGPRGPKAWTAPQPSWISVGRLCGPKAWTALPHLEREQWGGGAIEAFCFRRPLFA